MAQDSNLEHALMYDIAHQAQEKAVRARQQKLKRIAKAAHQPQGKGHKQVEPVPWHATVSASQRRGMRGEQLAAQYLRDQGLFVLARNIHCRTGEIDLVATDWTSLIFIEVRARRSRLYGGAAASINIAKQRRLIRTAQFFLPQLQARYFAGRLPPCRFDVICIDNEQLHWIKHAFDAL